MEDHLFCSKRFKRISRNAEALYVLANLKSTPPQGVGGGCGKEANRGGISRSMKDTWTK